MKGRNRVTKEIISFLGNGIYHNTKYGFNNLDGAQVTTETRFVQEAILAIVGTDAISYVG